MRVNLNRVTWSENEFHAQAVLKSFDFFLQFRTSITTFNEVANLCLTSDQSFVIVSFLWRPRV